MSKLERENQTRKQVPLHVKESYEEQARKAGYKKSKVGGVTVWSGPPAVVDMPFWYKETRKKHGPYLKKSTVRKYAKKYFQGWDIHEIYEFLGIDLQSLEDKHEAECDKLHKEWGVPLIDPHSRNPDGFLDAFLALSQKQEQEFWQPLIDRVNECRKNFIISTDPDYLTLSDGRTLVACRAYTYASSKNAKHSALQPVWKGMNKIDSDHEFLDFFLHVAGYMWD